MASLKDVFRTMLEGDATLTAVLTGGIYDASELPNEGVASGDPPAATLESDGIRTKPFAVIAWRGENPFQVDVLQAETRFVEVYLYQQAGYAAIDSAIARMKVLLHDQELTQPDNVGIAWCLWRGTLGELVAQEYGHISMNRLRFEIRLNRS